MKKYTLLLVSISFWPESRFFLKKKSFSTSCPSDLSTAPLWKVLMSWGREEGEQLEGRGQGKESHRQVCLMSALAPGVYWR